MMIDQRIVDLLRDAHKVLNLVGCTPENSRRDSALAEDLQSRILAALEETSGEKKCGLCTYWAHSKKRNCSSPATPSYYADCLCPVNETALPDCVERVEMHEAHGAQCPCFAPMKGENERRSR